MAKGESTADFVPGFRLSRVDIAVLVIGAAVAAVFWRNDPLLSCIVTWVVGHFFLFCNVVRMNRRFELIWAGFFAAVMAVSLATGVVASWLAFVMSAGVTVVLVLLEMRRVDYHGVFWRELNPGLPEWWEANRRR